MACTLSDHLGQLSKRLKVTHHVASVGVSLATTDLRAAVLLSLAPPCLGSSVNGSDLSSIEKVRVVEIGAVVAGGVGSGCESYRGSEDGEGGEHFGIDLRRRLSERCAGHRGGPGAVRNLPLKLTDGQCSGRAEVRMVDEEEEEEEAKRNGAVGVVVCVCDCE